LAQQETKMSHEQFLLLLVAPFVLLLTTLGYLVLLVKNKNTFDFSISGFGMHIVLRKNGPPDEVIITTNAVKHNVTERRSDDRLSDEEFSSNERSE
jgi:hypothetical protein